MLSIRQNDGDATSTFDSRCVALWTPVLLADRPLQLLYNVNNLLNVLEALKEEARSPLYLPFALSVYAVDRGRDCLDFIQTDIAKIAKTTYLELLNDEVKPTGRGTIVAQNEHIESALSNAAGVKSTLNGVESLWQYLETMAEGICASCTAEEVVVQSTNNILEAIPLLRKDVIGMREALRDQEVRIRDYTSLLATHLSQRDSETNIKAAVASRDLAKVASEDSSAMKSIAILTMFFLPGTFFSALFALPSLGWDQYRHFTLYWAFTVPATLLTFAIWAALTQRAVLLKWAKTLSASKWPWGFWRGKGGEVGDEEKGEKTA
ncbi:hypothetical protein QBC32DRAFT_223763 [Pseudoneurospora amorphoporcata]|uniref:Uncharacterized protein n=1 Tax=Pseudoneurospora amorphoporcata TaxID=241081 RepID=A0AAN6NKQ0_9PEZI|nr:hypothetical protein QBC32DRAFT_223763 [Pseudoneurospora amorphoporcata]